MTFVNVCGLKSKLLNVDFIDVIKQYDIICFLETKLDKFDVLDLPQGYEYITKNRENVKRKSGGIIVIYKTELSKCIKFIKSESEYVFWFELLVDFTGLSDNILFGCIYIPPENSKYASETAFDEIESELISFSKSSKYISLFGDFNARTNQTDDFVKPDESLFQNLHFLDELDDDFLNNFYSYKVLIQNNIPLQRSSEDKARCNNYGYKLIELCKRSSLYIANGRLFDDRNIGKTTCKNVSLIDYVLVSPYLFPFFQNFCVSDYDPMISDVHNRLEFSFSFVKENTVKPRISNQANINTHVNWDNSKSERFRQAITDSLIQIDSKLDDLLSSDNVSCENVNDIVCQLVNDLSQSATDIMGVKKPYLHKNRKNGNKPWFDKDCQSKRDAFHRIRLDYKINKDEVVKNSLLNASKDYKKQLNASYIKYQNKCADDLRNLNKSDPKSFWKMLNRYSNCKKDCPDVPLETFFEYFRDLNADETSDASDIDESHDENFDQVLNDNDQLENILNGPISENEVKIAISNLKNNKAAGIDNILNEYLKNIPSEFIPTLCKLFNIVLDSGIVPENWLVGIIKPVYKNKGDNQDPDNYRAITLISCLGKLFTSVLNSRLNEFSNELSLISENQAGFRKGYSTTDNIFVLHTLISLYLSSGKKLYCTFIDFRKAFDTVWRTGLWTKLQRSGIRGKCFNVIFNMYNNIKSCVQYRNEKSDFFPCMVGVRQGENLSPFLFSIFLNDLEDYFKSVDGHPLEYARNRCNESLLIYLEIFALLYADDTVIFAESCDDMQRALDIFADYCDKWKLSVNTSKTKVMIFCKRKTQRPPQFKLRDASLEIVDSYNYLGLLLRYNGSFSESKQKLVEQAEKAIFCVYTGIRNLNIPVDIQLKLFDFMISPILLYGSEVWGFENTSIIERVHLKFCKRIMNVRRSTPNFIVYGELGRFPLEIDIKLRMVSFYCRVMRNENKLSNIMLKLMFNLQTNGVCNFKWIQYVKSIFDSCGLTYIFTDQHFIDFSIFKSLMKQTLQDQFIQKWHSDINNSSRGVFYGSIKKDFGLENYLLRLQEKPRIWIGKFRSSNIKFPIETGRWRNVSKEERICTLCNDGLIGDEFHYLFICKNNTILNLRNLYVPKYYSLYPTNQKLQGMFTMCNTKLLYKISLFLKNISRML